MIENEEKKDVVETVITEPVNSAEKDNKTEVKVVIPEKSKIGSIFHKIIFTVFSIVLFVSVWTICDKIKEYGLDIALIRSVGGKTLEEAYYADIGKIYMYFADFVKVLTAGISGIILCITYK